MQSSVAKLSKPSTGRLCCGACLGSAVADQVEHSQNQGNRAQPFAAGVSHHLCDFANRVLISTLLEIKAWIWP